MSKHKQVPVKVNAFVDEGIADLISALSRIEGLSTLESCQGEPGEADAFVLFRHGDWRQSGVLLFEELMPALSDDLRQQVSLRLEGIENGAAMGSILVEPASIDELTRVVQSLTAAAAADKAVARPAVGASASASTASASTAVPKPAQPESGVAARAETASSTAPTSGVAAQAATSSGPRGLPPERAVGS